MEWMNPHAGPARARASSTGAVCGLLGSGNASRAAERVGESSNYESSF